MNTKRKLNRILLLRKHAVVICGEYRVKIDRRKIPLVRRWTWRVITSASGERYCVGSNRPNNPTTLSMARLILGLEFGDRRQADHRNSNGLDNRRKNLRIASAQQNAIHRRTPKKPGRSSRFKGVTLNRSARRWQAQVEFNGRNFYLGLFYAEEDAARAYNRKAEELFGKWALLNDL